MSVIEVAFTPPNFTTEALETLSDNANLRADLAGGRGQGDERFQARVEAEEDAIAVAPPLVAIP